MPSADAPLYLQHSPCTNSLEDMILILQEMADSAKECEEQSRKDKSSDYAPEFWFGVYEGLLIATDHLRELIADQTGVPIIVESAANAPDHTTRYSAAA